MDPLGIVPITAAQEAELATLWSDEIRLMLDPKADLIRRAAATDAHRAARNRILTEHGFDCASGTCTAESGRPILLRARRKPFPQSQKSGRLN